MRKKVKIMIIFVLALIVSGCTADSPGSSVTITPDEINTTLTNRSLNEIGEQGNLWDNESTGSNTPSSIVYTDNYPHISIFGGTSSGTTLSVYVSQDGEHFYLCEDLTSKINAGDDNQAHIFFTAGVRYYYLESSSNVTANFTLSAKP